MFILKWFSLRLDTAHLNKSKQTSGVSAGQIIPQWVLCSCLGRASLPSRPIGEFSRRKCDNVEANVNLFNTCCRKQSFLLNEYIWQISLQVFFLYPNNIDTTRNVSVGHGCPHLCNCGWTDGRTDKGKSKCPPIKWGHKNANYNKKNIDT